MGDILANNKALILKGLTYVIGILINWANAKYKLGIDPTALATSTAALIIGIAIHAGMKDHGATAAAQEVTPQPPPPPPAPPPATGGIQ